MPSTQSLPHSISERASFWETHVTQWKSSSLSRKDYCQSHQLAFSTFNKWCQRLQKESNSVITSTPVRLREVYLTSTPSLASKNFPLDGIQLKHPSGIEMTLSPQVSPELLKTVLTLLSTC